ncbi:hypothetical protein DAEQUDRAFT_185380 [Daedalea quercina L-15889]|uniref:Reverse transcriptase RNase H-like domain-containing protein n=1 Tax=Daedalea quercina L-15889 TaxID=1314783 RepID=A0A165KI24_9APHY|nr:hypothetical protein DAEQUDRAFT_185380 [Daedalea quercina L-15889]
MRSKHSRVKPPSYALLTLETQTQSGSLLTRLRQVSVRCTAKVLSGIAAAQLASCRRSSRLRSMRISHMKWRLSAYSKLFSNGKKRKLAPRLERWTEYLSRFDFEIVYVQGSKNLVADSFSRYFADEGADVLHEPQDYVSADIRIDPYGETLSNPRLAEIRAQRVVEHVEPRVREAEELAAHLPQVAHAQDPETDPPDEDSDPIALDSAVSGPPLDTIIQQALDLRETIRTGYSKDRLFQAILEHPEDHRAFSLRDGLLWYRPRADCEVLCVPRIMVLVARQTTYDDGIGGRTLPTGLLHSMPIPTRPWQSVGMDFVGPFPTSQGSDYLYYPGASFRACLAVLQGNIHLEVLEGTEPAHGLSRKFCAV